MNPRKLYIIQIGILNLAMTMMMTSAIAYRIDLANLEPYQLILLGTALEIAVIFFEIPTGLVADKYSRKLSVVIGYFIIGLGFLVELLTLKFIWIFLAQIIWGFGYTFISGALDAWVSDETHNKDIEQTYIKANTISKIMTIFGIIGALGFGIIDIRLPMFLSAILYILMSIVLIFVMKEKVLKEVMHHSMVHQFKLGLKHIFKHPM
ncbi:MAG: MFS transporter, partial [Acholeplasmataceae bacterium]